MNIQYWLPLFVVILAFFCISAEPVTRESARPAKVKTYIQKYDYLARDLKRQTGIPVAIIFAVAGLESNWGTSDLAVRGNNHFGIKSNNWSGPTYCKRTPEYDYVRGQFYSSYECFRKYDLIRNSYLDFGRYLKTRGLYDRLFYNSEQDYESWTEGLQRAGYATDPEYARKLMRLILEYRLF
ncbi:MAG: glucosaminidase domain-containing protein, partial [Saprospiraceae bacterium]|nr:glucosaminidase domain-containing protein [Saprospiraceae bacterium]